MQRGADAAAAATAGGPDVLEFLSPALNELRRGSLTLPTHRRFWDSDCRIGMEH